MAIIKIPSIPPRNTGESDSDRALRTGINGAFLAGDATNNNPVAMLFGFFGGVYVGERAPELAGIVNFTAEHRSGGGKDKNTSQ